MTPSVQTRRSRRTIDRYAGEWVAFLKGEIVEHDKELPGLMATLRERGLEKKASVLLVPRKDEGPYVLLI